MVESVIVAITTGGLTLLGVLISNNAKTAVMEEKIENLTREVREHNNFAKRVPIIEEQMKVVNHRVEDLEKADRQ